MVLPRVRSQKQCDIDGAQEDLIPGIRRVSRPPNARLLELAQKTLGPDLVWNYLAGDSSVKIFWRIERAGETFVGVDGSVLEAYRRAENRSFARIGRHLLSKNLPVPDILGANIDHGFFIIEDLGDERLSEVARFETPENRLTLYRAALEVLLDFQMKATEGFDTGWCSQTPYYDEQTILKYESSYFLDRFVNEYLKLGLDESAYEAEFRRLARQAAGIRPRVFFHRDFQSHNVMIKSQRIRVIDFQGARLGPPGYDLASLLIDPFAGLSIEEQQELLDYYIIEAGKEGLIHPDRFRDDYDLLSLHRNFQILGAFAWLRTHRCREAYSKYLPHALAILKYRLRQPLFRAFPRIRELVENLELPSEAPRHSQPQQPAFSSRK